MERFTVHPKNPEQRHIDRVAAEILAGAVAIIPTDTVYALACAAGNKRGVERICQLTGKKVSKTNLSLLVENLTMASEYTAPYDRETYRLLKELLPGPYTFILKADSQVAKLFESNKKQVGIRIPDHPSTLALIRAMEKPLVVTSLHSDDVIREYISEPDEIAEEWKYKVDILLEDGPAGLIPSTVLDCTSGIPALVRKGKGAWDEE